MSERNDHPGVEFLVDETVPVAPAHKPVVAEPRTRQAVASVVATVAGALLLVLGWSRTQWTVRFGFGRGPRDLSIDSFGHPHGSVPDGMIAGLVLPSLGLLAPICAALLAVVALSYFLRLYVAIAVLAHWLVVGLLCGLVAAEYSTEEWFPGPIHSPAIGLYGLIAGTVLAAAGAVVASLNHRRADQVPTSTSS